MRELKVTIKDVVKEILSHPEVLDNLSLQELEDLNMITNFSLWERHNIEEAADD